MESSLNIRSEYISSPAAVPEEIPSGGEYANVEILQQSSDGVSYSPQPISSSATFSSIFSLNSCRFCSMKFKSYGLLFKHITEVHLKNCKSNKKRKAFAKESQHQQQAYNTTRFVSRNVVANQDLGNVPMLLDECRNLETSNNLTEADGDSRRCDESAAPNPNTFCKSKKVRSSNRVKPFECRVCRCAFARRDTLKKHAATHTGEKPFACKVCGRTFSRKDKRKQHETLHTKRPFFAGRLQYTPVVESTVSAESRDDNVPALEQQPDMPDYEQRATDADLSTVVEELLANCIASVSPTVDYSASADPKLTAAVTIRTDSSEIIEQLGAAQMFAASSNSNTGDQSLATSFFLCSICGAEASDLVSGVPCCNRCRQFFEENCNNLQQFCCLGNSHCAIDAGSILNLSVCRFCYLQKCFAAGMKPISDPISDFISSGNGRQVSSQYLSHLDDITSAVVSHGLEEVLLNNIKRCENDQKRRNKLNSSDNVTKRHKHNDNQQKPKEEQFRLDKITSVIDDVIRNCSKCWACKSSFCKCNNTSEVTKHKPKYSWLELISQAFAQTKRQKLVTLVILCQIEKLYPYYRFVKDKSWKTSIVQCLSSSHYFIREQEKKCKDGFVWCLNPKFKDQLKQISGNGVLSSEIHSLPIVEPASNQTATKKKSRAKNNRNSCAFSQPLSQSATSTTNPQTQHMFACNSPMSTTVKSESGLASTYGGNAAYSFVVPSASSTIAAVVAGVGSGNQTNNSIYCRHCSRLVYNNENYLYHWKQYHSNVSPMEMFENTIHCSVCDFYVDSRRSYDEHCCSQLHVENFKRLSASNNRLYGIATVSAGDSSQSSSNTSNLFNRWAFVPTTSEDIKPFAGTAVANSNNNISTSHCLSIAAPLPAFYAASMNQSQLAAAAIVAGHHQQQHQHHQHQLVGHFDQQHHHQHQAQMPPIDMSSCVINTTDCSEMKLLNVFSLLNE